MMQFLNKYFYQILGTILSAFLMFLYRKVIAFEKSQKAIKKACILSLQGEMKDTYITYIKKGSIPLHKSERFYQLHKAYHDMGMNESYDDMFEEIKRLPIE